MHVAQLYCIHMRIWNTMYKQILCVYGLLYTKIFYFSIEYIFVLKSRNFRIQTSKYSISACRPFCEPDILKLGVHIINHVNQFVRNSFRQGMVVMFAFQVWYFVSVWMYDAWMKIKVLLWHLHSACDLVCMYACMVWLYIYVHVLDIQHVCQYVCMSCNWACLCMYVCRRYVQVCMHVQFYVWIYAGMNKCICLGKFFTKNVRLTRCISPKKGNVWELSAFWEWFLFAFVMYFLSS